MFVDILNEFAGPSACQITDNQVINPSIHQSIDQSSNRAINSSTLFPSSHHRVINPSTHQSIDQSSNHSVVHSIIQSFNLSIYHSMLCLCCLERAHGCLGAWECGPEVPGPPPLGSWGTSQGLPGGGPGSKLQPLNPVPRPFKFASKTI